MTFTATWSAGENPVSFEKVDSLAAARDIVRSRMVALPHNEHSGRRATRGVLEDIEPLSNAIVSTH